MEEYNDRQFYKKKSDLKRIKKRRRKKIAQDVQREKNTKIDIILFLKIIPTGSAKAVYGKKF